MNNEDNIVNEAKSVGDDTFCAFCNMAVSYMKVMLQNRLLSYSVTVRRPEMWI